MKPTLAALTCLVSLVAGLSACSGDESKAALPRHTGASSPSATATSRPPSTAQPTHTGPVAPVAHSTYTYGSLTVIVNLPADIPVASRPSMRVFSDFLQAFGRTTARNKVDPAMSPLASADVLTTIGRSLTPGSVEGFGSLVFTVRQVHTGTSGFTRITSCFDQTKVVQVRKGGSTFVDMGVRHYLTLKFTADVSPGLTGRKVTAFRFPVGRC